MDLNQERLDRLNDNRLYQALGLAIVEVGEGFACSQLRANAPLCWPQSNQPHGGIVFTQIDTTMATAVMTLIGEEQRLSTISADVQYTNPATGEYLRCEARCTHRTRRMAFIRSETHDPTGRLVALGQGTFRIFSENHGVKIA
jgi:uncharacterized protein (TIGR00369 family)